MMDDDTRRGTSGGRFRARLLVLVAAVLWSTSGFFAKAPIFAGWPGPVLAFWRALFAAAVLLPLVRRPQWSPRLLPMILAFALMNITFLTAMTTSEAANAIWLQNTAPVWVFLVGVFWFNEPAGLRDWLMLLFGTLGVGLILGFEMWGANAWGVINGLLSGVTYAAIILSLRQLRDFEPTWLIALNHLTTVVLLSPYLLFYDVWPHGTQWLYLAGFGILQMGLPYVLFARAVQTITGHEASGIVLLEPVLVPVWVFVAWHNHPSYQPPAWWTLAGAACILCGLLLRYVSLGRRRRSPTAH